MNFIYSLLLVSILALTAFPAGAKARKDTGLTAVAVVVDPVTYEKAGSSVDDYVASIRTPYKKGVLVLDRWNHPDSIRVCLMELYEKENLEGAVFIGDIPIAMVRDAQHLTSAFKMNQNEDWKESSIASDRFYDCFGLRFRFIRQDEDRPSLFYYSLLPDGEQTVNCTIYSSRIKPMECGEKHELIAAYLKKAVAAKRSLQRMDRVLHFAGHGYNSDSYTARIDESSAFKEHFPFLTEPGCRLDYLDYSQEDFIKYRLLSMLENPEYDFAMLHHHGSDVKQYCSATPGSATPLQWIALLKQNLRSRVRKSKDPQAAIEKNARKYGIDPAWISDAMDREVTAKDSLDDLKADIHPQDLDERTLNAKIVVLDACYNGQFCCDDYIAAHYIFNKGANMVAKANSVNSLQDRWSDELCGLLNLGVCAGNWAKYQMSLESHLFGDPTFAFASGQDTGLFQENADHAMASRRNDVKFWRKMLSLPDADRNAAEMRCLAIRMLHANGAITPDELLDIQRNSASRIVRMEAFHTHSLIADASFTEAILMGLSDNYELLQRMSAKFAAKNYSPDLIPQMVRLYMDPATSARVKFHVSGGLEGFDKGLLIENLKAVHAVRPYWQGQEAFGNLLVSIEKSDASCKEDWEKVLSGTADKSTMKYAVTGERNKCSTGSIEPMLALYAQSSDKQQKRSIAEALGWYVYSCRKPFILEKCHEMFGKETDPDLKDEWLKTINRLK